jgi:hypothetical protein
VVGQQHGAVPEILGDTVAAQPNKIILFADHSDDPVVSRPRARARGVAKSRQSSRLTAGNAI